MTLTRISDEGVYLIGLVDMKSGQLVVRLPNYPMLRKWPSALKEALAQCGWVRGVTLPYKDRNASF